MKRFINYESVYNVDDNTTTFYKFYSDRTREEVSNIPVKRTKKYKCHDGSTIIYWQLENRVRYIKTSNYLKPTKKPKINKKIQLDYLFTEAPDFYLEEINNAFGENSIESKDFSNYQDYLKTFCQSTSNNTINKEDEFNTLFNITNEKILANIPETVEYGMSKKYLLKLLYEYKLKTGCTIESYQRIKGSNYYNNNKKVYGDGDEYYFIKPSRSAININSLYKDVLLLLCINFYNGTLKEINEDIIIYYFLYALKMDMDSDYISITLNNIRHKATKVQNDFKFNKFSKIVSWGFAYNGCRFESNTSESDKLLFKNKYSIKKNEPVTYEEGRKKHLTKETGRKEHKEHKHSKKDIIIELKNKGYKQVDIVKETGLSKGVVSKWFNYNVS